MSRLGPFPAEPGQDFQHPVLRYIDTQQPVQVAVEVVRPKDLIGFKAAKFYLHLSKNGVQQPPIEYAWDEELNLAFVQRRIKSISAESEKVRFGLDLRYRLKRPESRYGDGFFNSVLMILVRELKLDEFTEVREVLPHIHTNRPHAGGNSLQDCRLAITTVFGSLYEDLRQQLKYAEELADEILAGAVSRYLDERFTVTDRIRLGWT
jgi:hypothetical protein